MRDTVDALAGLTRGHVTAGIVGAISSPNLDLPGLLVRPRLRGRIALAWRAGQPASPAARAFLNHARTQLTRPGTPAAGRP